MRIVASVKATHKSRAYFAKVRRSITVGVEAAATEVKGVALMLTSGTISRQQLVSMGHPYGRGMPSPGAWGRQARLGPQRSNLPRLPINRQSGRLQASLRVYRRVVAGGIAYQVQFTASYAGYILAPGGTKTMVARGFWTALRRRTRYILARNLAAASPPTG